METAWTGAKQKLLHQSQLFSTDSFMLAKDLTTIYRLKDA